MADATPGGGYAGQPNRTAASSQYGKAAASQRAQAAVPLPDVGASIDELGQGALPPGLVPLNRGTDRPDEPITEGASFGPGRQLSDLAPPPMRPEPPDIDPRLFAVYLPQLEAMAESEQSSHALRSFVRRLRMRMPIDFDPTAEAGAP
jgi:hypothetical protein